MEPERIGNTVYRPFSLDGLRGMPGATPQQHPWKLRDGGAGRVSRSELLVLPTFAEGLQFGQVEIASYNLGISGRDDMRNLSTLADFGGTDADNDPLLLDCFEDHPSYMALRDRKRYVILGRKGSGKTAVYKRILREYPTASGFNFSDYPWAHHSAQKQAGVPEEQCFIQSWIYFCLVALAKNVIRHADMAGGARASAPALQHIKTFLKDTYGTTDPQPDRIFSPASTLKFSPNFQIPTPLGTVGAGIESVPMSQLPRIANEVNSYIQKLLFGLIDKNVSTFLLFDQLDQGFDPASPDYKNRLNGLLLAAKSINEKANEAGVPLCCAVFLRDDIYGMLQFEDKNKITLNGSSIIKWDQKGVSVPGSGSSLKSLMEKRFSLVLGTHTPWDELFDETQQMTGKQTKYNYMRERTFLRPRDMIKFCNTVLAVHKIQSSEGDRFNNKDIIESQSEYSEYLINELDDEIHKNVPDYKKYLEVIRDIGYAQFSKEKFDETFEQRRKSLNLKGSPTDAMNSLFDFSIIGFQAVGGRRGGSDFVFKYKDEKATFSDRSALYRVHWGLRETLQLQLRRA